MTIDLPVRARDWAFAMTREESVNGSPGEARFAGWLLERIARTPGLAGRHCETFLVPVEDDPLGRAATGLLVRGEGRETVVLTGHFDTVPIEDYGDLAPLACDPERLAPRLLARLEALESPTPAEQRALRDLADGQFIPGRGLLDMKAGLAAGLAVCERHAADPVRRGNLLFLAVPDEEASSVGMRQVARSIGPLAAARGLDLLGAINLDSIADDGDGSAGRMIALGSIGKLLLTVLVLGRPAHACYPLAGINAGALAGAIAAEAEWAPELSDASRGRLGVAATLLSLKDSKAHYDVTTPGSVFASWNVLTFGRPASDVLEAFRAICRRALEGVAARLADRSGETVAEVPVVDFETLKAEASERSPDVMRVFAAEAARLRESAIPLPDQCRALTELLIARSGRGGPIAVIGFGSMPYLPVELSESPGARRLADAARRAAERHGIATMSHFPGISDLSFLGEADLASVPAIAANTPVFGHAIGWDARGAVAGIPSINAGPWGRDYHTPLERLHAPYAFDVLPRLVHEIVESVLR